MIICDFEMPAMDGFQALAAIASDTATRDIPFILASGEWTLENMLRKAGGRAADTFFSKPYVVHEIAAFVRRIFKSIEEDRAEVPASRLCLQKEDVKTI